MERQFIFLVFVVSVIIYVAGHGILLNPPGRSSMWRFGFDVPPNYDDSGLFCGGFQVQYNEVNQGRCGECGDEWSIPRPRPNDEGGIYGTGTIGQTYQQGSMINIQVDLTASHKGYFEFKLCSKSSAMELVTQECLNKNVLQLADGTTKFYVDDTGVYNIVAQLPPDVTCDYCVIQWHYQTGNSWGVCEDGTGAIGCGIQENFRSCADVEIKPV